MNAPAILELFRMSGALLDGHFRLSSGLHSGRYLQSALVLQYPDVAAQLGEALAATARGLELSAVVSPALGGIIIGHEVARALGVRALFAERQDAALTLRRGFTLSADDRVLVVEDVITTGVSTRETIEAVRAAGAHVEAAAAIVDRGTDPTRLDVPLHTLVQLEVPAYPADACPLCAAHVPITKPGSRG